MRAAKWTPAEFFPMEKMPVARRAIARRESKLRFAYDLGMLVDWSPSKGFPFVGAAIVAFSCSDSTNEICNGSGNLAFPGAGMLSRGGRPTRPVP